MYPTDLCLETGEYTDDCCCDFCTHREECSGYDGEDDDDDQQSVYCSIKIWKNGNLFFCQLFIRSIFP